jgi:hypothetical protein
MGEKKGNAKRQLNLEFSLGEIDRRSSAFVTNRALLGIKPVRRHAEHIIALDADAVDDRTYDGAGLDWFVQGTR